MQVESLLWQEQQRINEARDQQIDAIAEALIILDTELARMEEQIGFQGLAIGTLLAIQTLTGLRYAYRWWKNAHVC
jgi:hypothetical protein